MLNTNRNRSRIGSTPSLYAFRPTRLDTQNLRKALRAVATVDPHVSRSNLLRDGLALIAHQAQQGGDWVDLIRERQERAELERRLEEAERRQRHLERKANVAQRHARKKDLDLQRLTRHLPDVRRRVQLNMDFETGIGPLDDLWQACGRSWARVAQRLQVVQDDLDNEPPPGGG